MAHHRLDILQNEYWQIGVLPNTGASVAFGRVRDPQNAWVDVLRPTMVNNYWNTSACASFVLTPWSNRIRDAKFPFGGQEHQLKATHPDGTAIHGVGRKYPWQVTSVSSDHIRLLFRSSDHDNVNFPFKFASEVEYRLEGRDFVMEMNVSNRDKIAFPAGFGHHPYFVRSKDVQVQLLCDQQFELVDSLPSKAPLALTNSLDFRRARPLGETLIDDLFTARHAGEVYGQIQYPAQNIALGLLADEIYQQVVLYAPPNKDFFAVEPVTNANDGFNLSHHGVAGHGVFVLNPHDQRGGVAKIRHLTD
jgi:aldose 1-epimerase